MLVDIYIENEKLELFEGENISVTSSVLDIQDISKNTTDYTNAFTVPASEVNNKIFKHYYNANIDNTFDARVSVDGRIEIGGMPFRLGKILLQKVSVKNGVASAYTINFWGNLVSLKDVLGDDKLADLDLSAYNHTYDSDTVRYYLSDVGSLFSAFKYQLLAKKQYYYNSSASDTTMTDTRANIHYKEGTENGVLWDDLRPSLQLSAIIDAIEADYGITFSDDFFGLDVFTNLHLWLNNTVDKKIGGTTQIVNFTAGDSTNINLTTNIGTFYTKGVQGEPSSEWWGIKILILPLLDFRETEYTINFYSDSGELNSSVRGSGLLTMDSLLNANNKPGNEHTYSSYWEIVSTEEFEYGCSSVQTKYVSGSPANSYTTTGGDVLGSTVVISDNMPDLKIIDFLKGIFNAYKLVVIPQDDGTIYIDTVTSYYDAGQTLDLTNYIDSESVDVSRGEILNKISYKFQEPQTILNVVFKENTTLGYGDEEAELRDDNGKLLDGGELEIELPFEQVVYERLRDQNNAEDIELMYGAIIDKELNPVNPKAHIFYNQQKNVFGSGIGFINDDGTKTKIRGAINTAFHSLDALNNESFVFSAEFEEFSGAKLVNNLYSNYHQEYINSLFNVKRRNFKFKTKILPVSILLDLTLNDVIRIKDNYYRIDKFTTDLTSGKTELNLVNLL